MLLFMGIYKKKALKDHEDWGQLPLRHEIRS